ncbi:hypothetical protein [Laspinema olomoucense]|uniref:hypothetical protein n=1 Tax=Laspinema olomoucense TaxID=3231600 RepID=UPI0021BB15BC|nr:hypothetical protein [Laspinema sp. D3c]MCT7993542.1 hypothetical protein [Laspinema sp. D3c]
MSCHGRTLPSHFINCDRFLNMIIISYKRQQHSDRLNRPGAIAIKCCCDPNRAAVRSRSHLDDCLTRSEAIANPRRFRESVFGSATHHIVQGSG